jgi:thiol-disulfide isomerase/thioredoxin
MVRIDRLTEGLGTVPLLALLSLFALATDKLAAQSNDNFANAAEISGPTNFVVTANTAATSEPGEPAHALEPPTHSLWWHWTAPFTGSFSVSTHGSSFDTVLAVYQGTVLTNLTVVAANDDRVPFSDLSSQVFFRAYAGESFYIAVDGVAGARGNVQFAVGRAGYSLGAWQATNLSGGLVRSSDFTNKVMLVDYWETTCGACVEELPNLITLQDSLAPQGFTLVGLSGDPSPQPVIDFLMEWSVPYPMAMSNPDARTALGGLDGFPTKALIDREGRILGHYLGGNTVEFYYSIVRPLLRSAPNIRAQIRQQGTNVVISWPGTEFGYTVESRTNLSSASWIPTNGKPQMTNGQHAVTFPAASSAQFFRLRRPSN